MRKNLIKAIEDFKSFKCLLKIGILHGWQQRNTNKDQKCREYTERSLKQWKWWRHLKCARRRRGCHRLGLMLKKFGQIAAHLSHAQSEYRHPFLITREIRLRSIGLIVVTSDKGLCGGLNTNVLRTSITQMKVLGKRRQKNYKLAAIGNKGQLAL